MNLSRNLSGAQVIAGLLIGVGGVAALAFGDRFFKEQPKTLAEANMQARVWVASEVEKGREVTYRQLTSLGMALADADRKGDAALAMTVMTEATKILATWNDQSPQARTTGRDCVLATLNLAQSIDAVIARQGWPRRDQFDATLAGCKP